ncbi:hypothetical protein ACF09K_14510 [Streptomyces sp. NPDC014882]|uniref:hypothetical protein n=1 Tax=Streptomyces sp. NPDC014882 TaxID=3364927 RepID=UPI0036F7F362
MGIARPVRDESDMGLVGERPATTEEYGNPGAGRSLSVDLVHGGKANTYEYAHGDPLNRFDLDGEWSWKKNSPGPLSGGWGTPAISSKAKVKAKVGGEGGRVG